MQHSQSLSGKLNSTGKNHIITSRMDNQEMSILEYIPLYLHVTGRPTEWGSLAGIMRHNDLANYIENTQKIEAIRELEQLLSQELGKLDPKSQQRIQNADLHKRLLQKIELQKEKLQKGRGSHTIKETMNTRGMSLIIANS